MKAKTIKILSVILIFSMVLSAFSGCNNVSNYLVIFDSSGGTSVVSQAVESGKTAIKPDNPQKEGFEFVEWQLNNKTYDFSKPVNENITLVAVYKALEGSTIITITLDYQNGEANKTIEIIKGGELFEPVQPQKEGYTFVGWFLNEEKFDFTTKLNENITLTAKWEIAQSSNNQNANNTSSNKQNANSTSTDNKSKNSSNSSTIGQIVTSSKPAGGNQSTNTSTPKTSTKNDAFNNANEANIYKNAPKGEVHVLMWRNYHKSEQLLIDQYQKLTGVKVKTTVTTEKEYATKLVSMVSGGNSPDVVMFQSNNFPGLVTKSLQSLNTKYFQLDSDCWNKNYMDAYRINGVYFGVAMPSSWSCESSTYVTYYSPQVLKNCGVSTTPYELYKQGKWNWDTQADIVRKAKNKGLTGLALQSTDLFMLSAGVDFAKYDGKQYTNQLGSVKSNSLLTSAWMEVSKLNGDDCLGGWELSNVQQNKVGLFTAISYGMYNEGNWFYNSFAKNLEAVPVAGPKDGTAYTPVRPMVWGVPKKAKNPEGAAYFLRYYLDTSEFDQSSTFHNKQFETIYKTITSTSAKKAVMHGSGVTDYVDTGTYSSICSALANTTPSNVTTTLNSKKGSVDTGIKRANKDLARIK